MRGSFFCDPALSVQPRYSTIKPLCIYLHGNNIPFCFITPRVLYSDPPHPLSAFCAYRLLVITLPVLLPVHERVRHLLPSQSNLIAFPPSPILVPSPVCCSFCCRVRIHTHGRQANLAAVKQPSSASPDGDGGGGGIPDRWNPDTGPLEGVVIAGRSSKRGKKSKDPVAPEPRSDGAELGVALPPLFTKHFRGRRK